ncbi:MAG TPA: hypothetical protein VGE04_20640 [Chloroflexia bacterium]|jgi:Ni/Fe-hydrogenase subunit HybB-like protein
MGNVVAPPGVYAPELLFFAVMISAIALGDVADEARATGDDPFFQLVRGVLMFGGLVAAALFGIYQYDQIVGPGDISFRDNVTSWAVWLAGPLFITSLAAEILIMKIQGAAP